MARARSAFETGPGGKRQTVVVGSRTAGKGKARRGPVTSRPIERRYRQTLRRVDLWSVLKVSVCFYLCAMIVTLGAGIVLWVIARQADVLDNIESFMSDLGFEDFTFLSWRILRASTLLGLVLVALATVVTVLAGAFYNLFSELVGGIEVTVVEEDSVG